MTGAPAAASVDVGTIERTLRALAQRSPLAFSYRDPTTGDRHILSPAALAAENGFLPAIVSAGEAVWREATGTGFDLDIARDPEALLGYRLRAIRAGSFTSVMLSSMEALAQVSDSRLVHVSDLAAAADAALTRAERASPAVSPARPAAPSGARP